MPTEKLRKQSNNCDTMASEIDPVTFEQQIDQIILELTANQSRELAKKVTVYYKAGSDDVRPSTRLTNVQKNAIKKLSVEHFGYISEFNRNVGEQIKDKARELLKQEKGYAEVSNEIRTYAEKVFEGSNRVVIDNRGKTRTVFKVGKDGTIRKTEKVITRPYVTNVKAYSDMLGRSATHAAWEDGRTSEYQRMGFNKWRFVGPSDERGRPDHIAILGQIFEYGTEQSDYAESLLHEPNCRHRQVVFFDDPELDTPQEFFDEQKRKAGLRWDDEKDDWTFGDVEDAPKKYPEAKLPTKPVEVPPPTELIEFVPAKTIKEAEEWTRGVAGIKSVDFKGLDIRTANTMNESLAKHLTLEPELKKNIQYYGTIQGQNRLAYQIDFDKAVQKYKETFGGTEEEAIDFAKRRVKKKVAPPNTYAWSWNRKDEAAGIGVNSKYGKNYDDFVARTMADVEAGFHPVGCDSPIAIVDHEFGHALDDIHAFYIQDKTNHFFKKENAILIKDGLSRYAMTNKKEFIAEIWSEYQNNPSPRPIAKEFGDRMMEQINLANGRKQ